MTPEIMLLCGTAAAIGFGHTVLGPDHYLPFIAMSKVGKWSLRKTALVTLLCGIGHVLGSVVIGLIGVAVGVALQLEALEALRGDIAAWLLLGFGLAYLAWGIHRAIRNKPHSHSHIHDDETTHSHEHAHQHAHAHIHDAKGRRMTPWILFTIFVFGPCEPLIPLLMYPASQSSTTGMLLVTAVFAVITVCTMLTIVLLTSWGISFARIKMLERYSHALAGATITVCGLAIHLGL